MNKFKKATLLTICSLIFLNSFIPTFADTTISKDESVYAILENDGTVKDVTVSEWLHSDQGFDNYEDTTDLRELKALNSNEEIRVQDGKIIFNNPEKDIYYQGKSDKDLPFCLDIHYYLDGQEYKAQELLDKSGHLKMTIEVKNNLAENQILPLILMTNLNNEEFTNIKINHGEIVADGQNQMLVMPMVIGLNKVVEGLDIIDFQEYLFDEFIIECEAYKMSVPSVMGASAYKEDISLKDFNIDVSAMDNDLNNLKDANNKIKEGTAALKDANVELNSKMQEFQTQVKTFKEATASLNANSAKLTSSMHELKLGIDYLVSNIESLMQAFNVLSPEEKALLYQNLKELKPLLENSKVSLATMKEALLAVSQKINNIDQVIIAGVNKDELKMAYGSLIDSGIEAISKEIKASIGATTIDPSLFINNDNFKKVISILMDGGMSEEEASALLSACLNLGAVDDLKNSLANNIENSLTTGSLKENVVNGALKINDTVINKLASALKENLTKEFASMNGLLVEANKMIEDVENKMQLFESLSTKVDLDKIAEMLKAMEDGESIKTLKNGASAIDDGMKALAEGSKKIDEASAKILEATNSFSNATNTLKDKTKELDDGVINFSKEGIEVLDNKLHDLLDEFKTIQNKLHAVIDANKLYTNYALASKDAKTSTKFIIKTEEILKESKPVETTEKVKEKTNFFERIINLFK